MEVRVGRGFRFAYHTLPDAAKKPGVSRIVLSEGVYPVGQLRLVRPLAIRAEDGARIEGTIVVAANPVEIWGAQIQGRVVVESGCVASLNHCSVSDDNGAAITVAPRGVLTMEATTVVGASPQHPAVFCNDGARCTVTDGLIRATVQSALVAGRASIVSITGTAMENELPDYPTLWAYGEAKLALTASRLRAGASNVLKAMERSSWQIEQCQITGGEGRFPALYLEGTSTMALRHCQVVGTRAGAVELAAEAAVTLQDTRLGSRAVDAATLLVAGHSRIDMEAGSVTAESGAAVSVTGQGSVQLTGTEVKHAGGRHAALFAGDQAGLSLTRVAVTAEVGCALYLTGRAQVSVSETQWLRPSVQDSLPAVIVVSDTAQLTMRQSALNVGSGGALYIDGEGSADLSACRMTGGTGVAVSMAGASQLTGKNLEVVGFQNAVNLRGGVCRLMEGRFGPTAERYPVLFIGEGATLEVVNAIITEAGGDGVYFASRSVGKMGKTTVQQSRGHGVVISELADVAMTGCLIEENARHAIVVEADALGSIDRCVLRGNGASPPLANHSGSFVKIGENFVSSGARPVARGNPDPAGTETGKETGKQNGRLEPSPDEALGELGQLVGLDEVKQSIRDLTALLAVARDRRELKLADAGLPTLHALFLGRPGTGKTTVARLMGNLFKSIGMLPKGHVVEVDRSRLVGQYIGETAQKTQAVIREAMGGVLFVDEAYALVQDPNDARDFGREAVDTLLKAMEDHRHEFVVIAAGYPDKMRDFLQSNPGLRDRFGQTFHFADYTPSQLMTIWKRLTDKAGFVLDEEALNLVQEEFGARYQRRDNAFANARMVRTFLEQVTMAQARRLAALPADARTVEVLTRVTVEDITPLVKYAVGIRKAEPLSEVRKELDGLVGLASVKDSVRSLAALIQYAEERRAMNLGGVARPSYHSVFVGNPGTGKTTVARIMGAVFKSLGVLERGHVVEVDRSGLVAGFIGQTALKTERAIDEAMGGVLFVDEAYTLNPVDPHAGHDFGREAIETLLKAMEDRRDALVVICAGYPKEMEEFLDSNPGLASRFTHKLHFANYNVTELMEIFQAMAVSDDLQLAPDLPSRLASIFQEAIDAQGDKFSNGRFARNLYERAKSKMALRVTALPKEERTREAFTRLAADDLPDLTGLF